MEIKVCPKSGSDFHDFLGFLDSKLLSATTFSFFPLRCVLCTVKCCLASSKAEFIPWNVLAIGHPHTMATFPMLDKWLCDKVFLLLLRRKNIFPLLFIIVSSSLYGCRLALRAHVGILSTHTATLILSYLFCFPGKILFYWDLSIGLVSSNVKTIY